MTVWTGWRPQLLEAAGFPDSPDNDTFLRDWHASAASDCNNNPVDISYRSRGATNCKRLTATRRAQNYPSHGAAARAFASEVRSGTFPALAAALKSGSPYDVPNPKAVIGDLIVWGSAAFAFELQQNYGPPHGGGGGDGVTAPHLHKGWHDLRRSFNKNMPDALHKGQKNTERALRELSKARRVKL